MKSKRNRYYTFFVIGEGEARKMRWTVSESTLITGGFFLTVFIFIAASLIIDYMSVLLDRNENTLLREKVSFLESELGSAEGRLNGVENALERMNHFYVKLKLISDVKSEIDSQDTRTLLLSQNALSENQALKQVKQAQNSKLSTTQNEPNLTQYFLARPFLNLSRGEVFRSYEKYTSFSIRLNQTLRSAHVQERSLVSLYEDLLEKRFLLDSTPSIRPVSTWISSAFGYRRDPFLGEIAMHYGVDFSGPVGHPIRVTADGLVRYTGYDNGYGKFVIVDHGYGLSTYYAHNSKLNVKVGQKVSRRDVIAFLGNTGRSTGPHLHYEVRLNGVPINPQNYMLGD